MCVFAIYAYFCVPEMKGIHPFLYLVVDVLIVDGSLEEIDELFEGGVSSGEFKDIRRVVWVHRLRQWKKR